MVPFTSDSPHALDLAQDELRQLREEASDNRGKDTISVLNSGVLYLHGTVVLFEPWNGDIVAERHPSVEDARTRFEAVDAWLIDRDRSS
jgi:hypothetical protein